ncbi:CesT family type III secretion system chaperone [Parachitinimonas caeni]|uniref:CesT family type III secretion system chaperone n=1 Tax=Parachitinimonas caeni TaxID=3031301 RepID=A0ABT7DRM0_9NEIS|nr:CesT family type III secretion system chaperone [Parachitinimonas caeni]MDK2122700.1 CesT family type III secretion system chaperone [Parachitinimonas caeni]
MTSALEILLNDYCNFNSLPTPRPDAAGAYLFTLEDVAVHVISKQGQVVYLGAWIGELPLDPHPGLVLKLLQANAPDSSHQPFSIGLDQASELLCWARIPLAALTTDHFDALLRNLALTVRQWREELDSDEAIPLNEPVFNAAMLA